MHHLPHLGVPQKAIAFAWPPNGQTTENRAKPSLPFAIANPLRSPHGTAAHGYSSRRRKKSLTQRAT
jgi:hypothetical protein